MIFHFAFTFLFFSNALCFETLKDTFTGKGLGIDAKAFASHAYDYRTIHKTFPERYYEIKGHHDSRFYDGKTLGLLHMNKTTKKLFVSFKGTTVTSRIDWTFNLLYDSRNLGDIQNLTVHMGFKTLAWASYRPLRKILAKLFYQENRDQNILDYEIFFVGHSRGGAVAVLSAILLNSDKLFPFWNHTNDFAKKQFNTENNIKILTFAAPRCLTKASAAIFPIRHENHVRILDPYDLVTRMPTNQMGYSHTGIPFHVRSSFFWKLARLVLGYKGSLLFGLFLIGCISMSPSWFYLIPVYLAGKSLFAHPLELAFPQSAVESLN